MDIIYIALVVVAVTMAGLSWIIFTGEKTTSNKIFSLFILSCGLWSIGIFSFEFTNSIQIGLIASNFNYFIAFMIAGSFLIFSYTFPGQKKIKYWQVIAVYTPAIISVFGTSIFSHLILTEIYYSSTGVKLTTVNVPVYMVYAVIYITYILVTYLNLFRSYLAATESSVKIQLRYILIGTLVQFIIAMYFDLILPIFDYTYVWIGPLMGLIFVYVIVYAVYKHHLLNTEILTAELLMVGLWIFIGIRTIRYANSSELATNTALFTISIIIGIFLIRSFRRENNIRKRLSDLNLHLSQKVAEQTADIQRAFETEKKARRDLEKLNDSKNQFIMITQHHLRAPTTTIDRELEDMQRGAYGQITPEMKTSITDARVASERLSHIIDDFLKIAALKPGASMLNISRQSLLPAIDDILGELKLDIARLRLCVDYPHNAADWPDLPLDHAKMREILLIVIENAVKYNRDRGSIDISTRSRTGMFEISIKNSGIGIDCDEIIKIGSAVCYRGDSARSQNPTGMGIGLSVVKAIVRAHHGTFSITSSGKGKGALAVIALPLKQAFGGINDDAMSHEP